MDSFYFKREERAFLSVPDFAREMQEDVWGGGAHTLEHLITGKRACACMQSAGRAVTVGGLPSICTPLLSEGTICGLLAVLRNRQQLFVLSQLQEYQEPVCHWGLGSFWCAPGVFVETLLRGA